MLNSLEQLEQELSELQLEPSKEEIARLEVLLEKLDTVENAVNRAKRASIDIGNLDSQILNARTQIQRILREYK